MNYREVRNLCNEIHNENTEEAIKIIEKSNNLNKTTYPPSLKRLFITIDYVGGMTTPLIEAVEVGNEEIIEVLLENGAYVVDKSGYGLIDSFIKSPYVEECIDCVLEYTDYNINTIQPDGKTFLMHAVKK